MKKLILAECGIVLFLIIGCSHIPFIGNAPSASEMETQPAISAKPMLVPNNFVEKGRVINKEILQKGKNIAIIPFTAGVGVEASNELDKVALMIVKGVSDVFADDHTGKRGRFNVVTAENYGTADLIVQGHILDMKSPSKVKKWVLLKGQKSLSIDGKMIDIKTSESVLVFEDAQKTREKEEGHDQLGYRIGENIGHFILSSVE